MAEEWRTLPNHPKYQVSDAGRIRTARSGRLKSTFVESGYPHVHLWRNGQRERHRIHRLVALAFIPNPQNLPIVSHVDGDSMNAAAHNLSWASARDNAADRTRHRGPNTGERNHYSVLTEAAVMIIRADFESGRATITQLARRYGISHTHVRRVVDRTIWKHVP